MNIRQAILKAADSIEREPQRFDFMDIRIPDDCGTPGCAVGWIASHMGVTCEVSNGLDGIGQYWCHALGEIFPALAESEHQLYDDIKTASGKNIVTVPVSEVPDMLRLYADKYHPAQRLPDSVLAIFEQRVAA